MIREPMIRQEIGHSNRFQWRGTNVSRLEGFTDAVFGFALTLLVVSLEVPQTYDELLGIVAGFIPFASSFVIFSTIWYLHYIYFRRYGLEDGVTIVLNFILVFVVLFYVYPLKFLFTLFSRLERNALPVVHLPGGQVRRIIEPQQFGSLFTLYGLGLASIFLVFTLFYLHAYRSRERLNLNPLEVNDTLESLYCYLGTIAVSLTSVAVVKAGGGFGFQWAWLSYCSLPAVMTLIGAVMGRKRRKLEARLKK